MISLRLNDLRTLSPESDPLLLRRFSFAQRVEGEQTPVGIAFRVQDAAVKDIIDSSRRKARELSDAVEQGKEEPLSTGKIASVLADAKDTVGKLLNEIPEYDPLDDPFASLPEGEFAPEVSSARLREILGSETFQRFSEILSSAGELLDSGASIEQVARVLKYSEGVVGSAFSVLVKQGDTDTFRSFVGLARGLAELGKNSEDTYSREELEQLSEQFNRLIDFQSGAWKEQGAPSVITNSLNSIEALARQYVSRAAAFGDGLQGASEEDKGEIEALRQQLNSLAGSERFKELVEQISALADTVGRARDFDAVAKAARPLAGTFGSKIISLVEGGKVSDLKQIAGTLHRIAEGLEKFGDAAPTIADVMQIGKEARDLSKILKPDALQRSLAGGERASTEQIQDAYEQFRLAFSQEAAENILRELLKKIEEAFEAQGKPDPARAQKLLFTL